MKIFIYFEEEFLGVYPSIINCINILSPTCSSIKILSGERDSAFPDPPNFPSNVSISKVRQKFDYNRNHSEQFSVCTDSNFQPPHQSALWKKLIPERFKVFYRIARYLLIENISSRKVQIPWLSEKIRYYLFCIRQSKVKKDTILIAIDESGIIAASLVKLFCFRHRPKLVFWSLETGLITGKSIYMLFRMHEWCFSFAAKSMDVLVTQEESRLGDLEKKLGFRAPSIPKFFIPHSPITKHKIFEDVFNARGNFFKNMFNLSKNDKVILHAGWIHDSMCVDKFAVASKAWKNQFKLVLHEREKRSPKEKFIRHIREISNDKVCLSLNPVPFDCIDEVVSSAHIGLIAYDKSFGDGRVNIRKSSGKLAQYLKCGIPVIALDLPGYKEMFKEYRCGLAFKDFEEIERCIDTILNDYNSFSKEAFRCFQEEFDFKKYFHPFLHYILKTEHGLNS